MRFRHLIASILIICSLSGCSVFRAIFGGHDDANPPIGDIRPQGNGDGYAGMVPRSFYWVQPVYNCTNSDGSKVSSYRDRIDVYDDGNYIQRGDSCSTSNLGKGKTSDLEISGNLLGYGDGIYQKGK